VHSPSEPNKRIRELVAKIQTEKDQIKFTALVEELNCLLDGKPVKKLPAPPCLTTHSG
jgi:hypothetical protein